MWAGELGVNQDSPQQWLVSYPAACVVGHGRAQISAVFWKPALPWSPGRTYSLLSTGSKEHSPVASSRIIFMLNFVLVLRRNDT